MGRPDRLDRIAQILVGLALVFSLLNGLFMLLSPLGWYQAVTTVRFTGPPTATSSPTSASPI